MNAASALSIKGALESCDNHLPPSGVIRSTAAPKAFPGLPVANRPAPKVTRDRLLVERSGMKYMRMPMTTRQAPTPAMIDAFLHLVTDPANQPVYVHCVGGRHRTGVMTAVYRMSQDGWTAAQAFKEMKQFKFGADYLHPEFKRFVY